MLFLFVLMLVGRDAPTRCSRCCAGSGWPRWCSASGSPCCWSARSAGARRGARPVGLAAGERRRAAATSTGIGRLIFTDYLFPFELTSALLITAALGAMVLRHTRQARGARQARPAGHRRGPAARRARPDLAAARPRRLRHRQLGGHARAAARRLDRARSRSRRSSTPPRAEPVARAPRSTAHAPHRHRTPHGPDAPTPSPARTDAGGAPVTPTYYLLLSALLFAIGAVGVLVRRNAIVVFMCIELMLNAVNLSLVTFARINGQARRPGHRVLRDGRRRGRGRRRARDHHVDLPHPPDRVRRRREPAEVLRQELPGAYSPDGRPGDPVNAVSPTELTEVGAATGDASARLAADRAARARRARAVRRRPPRRPRGATGSACGTVVAAFVRRSGDLPRHRRRWSRRSAPGELSLYDWIQSAALDVDFGLRIDPLSLTFVLLITGVGVADPHLLGRLHGATTREPAAGSSPT